MSDAGHFFFYAVSLAQPFPGCQLLLRRELSLPTGHLKRLVYINCRTVRRTFRRISNYHPHFCRQSELPLDYLGCRIHESSRHHEAQGLCATLDSRRQRLADCRNSHRIACIEGVPVDTLRGNGCRGHVPGVGSSLFLLARDCALACRAVRRHSFPLLYNWGNRKSRGLAAGTAMDI